MFKKITLLLLVAGLLSSSAYAYTEAGTVPDIASLIGSQAAITATLTCNIPAMTGNAGGQLGTVNQLLCIMSSLGLTGPTGAKGLTRVVSFGGNAGSVTMHLVLNGPGPAVNGVGYAYEVKLWTCGTNCTSTAGFLPAVYAEYNVAGPAINNGYLINNYSASSGTLKGTSFIQWDLGNATINKYFKISQVDCSSAPTFARNAVYLKTGTLTSQTDIFSNSPGAVSRNALSWMTNAGLGNWFADNTVNAGGDSPAWLGSFSRVASGSDYAYTDTGAAIPTPVIPLQTFQTAVSGATISGATWQGIDCTTITATAGVPAINIGTGVFNPPLTQANNGMPLNPPNI
jgi:hypothetical protein